MELDYKVDKLGNVGLTKVWEREVCGLYFSFK